MMIEVTFGTRAFDRLAARELTSEEQNLVAGGLKIRLCKNVNTVSGSLVQVSPIQVCGWFPFRAQW